MEISGRPVTGYPAPNPNPNSYSTNPPPAGSAYPYPSANPYYQRNYRPAPNAIHRATWLRRILALAIGFVVLFAAITFIVWLFLRPHLPQFQVDSLSITSFTVGNSSVRAFAAQARLTARNPNKKMTLSYDHIEAIVYYKYWSLSDTMIPPFSQGPKNQSSLTANFTAAGSFLDKSAVDGINGERGEGSGTVGFNLRMLCRVRFKAKAWRTRIRSLKVFCGELVVGIPSNGTLTGGSKRCRVGT